MTQAPIVVLAPGLDSNGVGRAMVLADLLRDAREVHLAGPRASLLWPPLASRTDVSVMRLPRNPLAARDVLRERWPAATYIASKPLLASFGLALLLDRGHIMLDIDDPEIALATTDLRTLASALLGPQNPVVTAGLLALRNRAKALTVANSILQARHGGTVVPHARDERIFSESIRDRARARRAVGVSKSHRLIVYVGTLRSHKGIGVLRQAVRLIRSPVQLAVIGGRLKDPGPNEIGHPPVDYQAALRWVAAADVVAVPQADSRVARSQSPAKLGDALAVGRAIVTTRLEVLEEIVGNAALFATPGSARSLSDHLTEILDDDHLRVRLETAARARFEATLSFAVVRPKLLGVLARVESAGYSSLDIK